MSILSDLFSFLLKILVTVIAVVAIIYLPGLLLEGVSWAAFQLSTAAAALGLPAWVIGGLTSVSAATAAWSVSALAWAGGTLSFALSAFGAAGLKTQAIVLGLTGLLVDPDGATELLSDVVELATDVGSSLLTPVLPYILGGVVLYFLFKKDKEEEPKSIQQSGDFIG